MRPLARVRLERRSTERERLRRRIVMDRHGHIYALTDEERKKLDEQFPTYELAPGGKVYEMTAEEKAKMDELREDAARLDGYLRGRADSDRPKRGPGANRDLAG